MPLENIYQILPINCLIPWSIFLLCLIYSLSWLIFRTKLKKEKKYQYFSKKKEITNLMSLFIAFDPTRTIKWGTREINWLIIAFIILIFINQFWSKPNFKTIIEEKVISYVRTQFEIALKRKKDRRKIIFTGIFFLIFLSNFIGLIPNIFTSRSHLTLNLFISVPIWLGFFLFGWMIYTQKIFAHLVPNRTPTILIRFIVLIERIRNLIRPITLRIRLIANIVSGHLLLSLIGNAMILKPIFILIILVIIEILLITLEISVSLIQAYVFCILITLYSDESDYN